MRLVPISLLMLSCAALGGVLPKKTADTDYAEGGNSSGVFYWKQSLRMATQVTHT